MNDSKSEVKTLGYIIMSGTEGRMLGPLITSGSALFGVILAKCRCVYRRDSEWNCSPACGLIDKPLDDHQEKDIFERTVDDIPMLIVTKKQ